MEAILVGIDNDDWFALVIHQAFIFIDWVQEKEKQLTDSKLKLYMILSS